MHPPLSTILLTRRERQTLRHLLKGRTESQTAKFMGLGVNTVHVYVKALYRKFRVSSRSQLLAKFVADIKF